MNDPSAAGPPAAGPPAAGPPAAAEPLPAADALGEWRRLAPGRVLLDGFHALKHALRFAGRIPVALTTDRAATLRLAEDLAPDLLGPLGALLTEVDARVLAAVLPKPHPTGVAALAERPSRTAQLQLLSRLPRTAPVVLLDEPRNLGNAGAVIRLAAGFGATGVVTTGTLDPWHPTVVRGGAGLHWATAVERLDPGSPPPGPVYALDPEGEDLRGLVLPDDAVLAFGSERTGLTREVRDRADHLVSLPMRPAVSSYNLATSVGMTLFHWSAGSGRPAPTG